MTDNSKALSPLIFSIFLSDLFYFLDCLTVVSYVDDTTPYRADKTKALVRKEIEDFRQLQAVAFVYENIKMSGVKLNFLYW